MTADIPEAARDLLDQALVVDLATVRPDGGPQVNPMWFLFEDGLIWFTHTDYRQKFRNLQHESRVAISILPEGNPYDYLEIRGELDRIEPDPTGTLYTRLAARSGTGSVVPPEAAERVKSAIRPPRVSGNALKG